MMKGKSLARVGRAAGFTLIELLVVVSIIALVLGILLPALGSARTTAKLVKCASHQRQVGLALMAYAGDYDGHVPPSIQSAQVVPTIFYKAAASGLDAYDLRPMVKDYVGDFAVWVCPSVDNAALLDDPGNVRAQGAYGTYAYFPGRLTPLFDLVGGVPTSVDHLNATSSMTVLSDRYREYENATAERIFNHGQGVAVEPVAGTPSYAAYLGDRADGINTLFFDGHVAWTPDAELDDIGNAQTGSLRAFGVLPE